MSKPRKYKSSNGYKQGTFFPKNKDKFIGKSAKYRSGLELKFFKFLDNNPNVLKWGSENVVVPYVSPLDCRVHRYFVDNYVEIREGNVIKKYLIEIKPFKQTKPPTGRSKNPKTVIYESEMWVVNQEKWKAAKAYAESNNMKFKILTEKDIK